jgi:hypothetical protein
VRRELPGGFELDDDPGRIDVARWLLHTKDAHELYEKFGFRRPGERLLERDRR